MSFCTFRGNTRPSLGVELELQLVDARSMALVGAYDEVAAEVPPEFEDSVKPEFYESCLEINTHVCHDVEDVEHDLTCKLAAADQAARRRGILLGWGATHPFSHWRDQPVASTPRYLELAEHYRDTLCRQVTFGLHVHVGVPDGDTAVHICRGMVEHLPALVALSANSPFWCGHDTGHHSWRVGVMDASPTGGMPPRLVDWGDYVRFVERLTAAKLIQTAKDLWWDVRPNPEFGTVEVRVCDMPSDLASVLGLSALIQSLVVDLERNGGGAIDDESGLMIVRQNRWLAARYGLGATLVDPRTGRTASARGTIRDLIERLRGIAATLGCERRLEQARELADGPGGAERQRAVLRRTGDLTEVVRQCMIGFGEAPPVMRHHGSPALEDHETLPSSGLRLVNF